MFESLRSKCFIYCSYILQNPFLRFFVNRFVELRLNYRFDHARYSLRPAHDPLSAHPTVNDDLPNRIITGHVIIKPDIRAFTESGVVFDDGTKADIDVVFLATGYSFGFPFLDKSVLDVKQNKVNLYKWLFPPDLEKQTLCVIGCIQPLGAIMPISESQCRLFARVVKVRIIFSLSVMTAHRCVGGLMGFELPSSSQTQTCTCIRFL